MPVHNETMSPGPDLKPSAAGGQRHVNLCAADAETIPKNRREGNSTNQIRVKLLFAGKGAKITAQGTQISPTVLEQEHPTAGQR